MALEGLIVREFCESANPDCTRHPKNGIAVENLIVDDELKHRIVGLYNRKDYRNPEYWAEKNSILKEYHKQCSEHLVNEYGWPISIAKKTASLVHIPRNRTSLSDYFLGYTIGNLPKRYVEPIAKLMGTDRRFYTKINILADALILGVSAYLINKTAGTDGGFFENALTFKSGNIFDILLKANIWVRALQTPLRTAYHIKGRHTWSPASLITPNIVGAAAILPLLVYDILKTNRTSKP